MTTAKIALDKLITAAGQIPVLPDMVLKIMEVTANPQSSAADLAKIIEHDISLCTSILKLSNSAYYGRSRHVDQIIDAIVQLGFDLIKSHAISYALMSTHYAISEQAFSLKDFWRHSIATGLIARKTAYYLRIKNPGSFFLPGLLHDLGKLIILMAEPTEYLAVVNQHKRTKVPLYDVEEELLGIDHATIGHWLADYWKFPVKISVAIGNHHKPTVSKWQQETSEIIHLADHIVHAREIGASGCYSLPPPKTNIITSNAANLSWEELLDYIDSQQDEIESVFQSLF